MFPMVPPSDQGPPERKVPKAGDGEDEQNSDDLVTIATFPLLNAAELARLHLREEGIQAILLDAETVNMDWFLGNALGYIKLQVLRFQAEAALEVLDKLKPTPLDRQTPETEEDDVTMCLACGQEIPETESQCPSCGWSFVDDQDN